MINSVVQSVCHALKSHYDVMCFSEDIEHLSDKNENPFFINAPCFYVSSLKTERSDLLKNRYILTIPLIVRYYANKDKSKIRKEDLRRIMFELTNLLKQIDFYENKIKTGIIIGSNIDCGIEENILHFMIDYKLIINSNDDVVIMENYSLNIEGV